MDRGESEWIAESLEKKYNEDKITLKKGTYLYRSAIDICDCQDLKKCKKRCSDTGKRGVYFSDNILIPVGMAFEYIGKEIDEEDEDPYRFIYKEPFIGMYETTEDIELFPS